MVRDLQGLQIFEPNPFAVEQGFVKTRQLHFDENDEEERKINELMTYMFFSDYVLSARWSRNHMDFTWFFFGSCGSVSRLSFPLRIVSKLPTMQFFSIIMHKISKFRNIHD